MRILILSCFILVHSCIPLKERKLVQPDKNLKLNEYGLVSPPEIEHKLKVGDILTLNLISQDPNASSKFGRQYTEGVLNPNEGSYYAQGLVIDQDGNVEIPRLGKIYLLGKTTDEASKILQNEFERTEYKKDAIFVRVQLAGINYTISGEVVRPGAFLIYRRNINILEVIARAGDFTEVADRKKVRLIRKELNGLRIVDLDITSESILNSEYFYIQPNDQIIVNPKAQKVLGTGVNTLSTIGTTLGLIGSIYTTIIILNRL